MDKTGNVKRQRRKAIVYVRQSTEDQVEHNQGSRAHQFGQAELARAMGFADDQIEVIEDAGLSGSASAHRPRYQYMVSEISKGAVDLVIASDSSRITRDSGEWIAFLQVCANHGVKLVLDGRPIDPSRGDERFVNSIIGVTADYENWRRRETMTTARRARAMAGRAVAAPPAGYVRGPDGTWLKDERPRVQDSIDAQFHALREKRSLRQAVKSLRADHIETPRRAAAGGIRWVLASVASLCRLLHNPAYVGDLVFGRRRSDPLLGRDSRGHYRQSPAPPEDVIVVRDHHEPYISREEHADLLELLKRNQWCPRHGVLGPGTALAQGCLRCGKHHNWLMTSVLKDKGRSIYRCIGESNDGGRVCGSIPQWVVDGPLREAVVTRLRPHALVELQEVCRKAELDDRAEARRRRDELHYLRREVEDLELRCARVDPQHWAVAKALEERQEQKRRELLRREREENVPAPRLAFGASEFDELRQICSDIDELLDAPTTNPRDRKELVRILVDRVVVEERTREHVRLRIVWQDGADDTLIEVLLFPYAHRIMAEMATKGATPEAIALRLNEIGVRTKVRAPWTAQNVRRRIWLMRHGIKSRQRPTKTEAARDDGGTRQPA